ncbi:MAG: cob(I)yrinic acid a,c-diamide adenosyltransferase [Planctomycetes bacterium]|nr:cob(I)yrinic acid a,c-diamide adenosyltransferase [Planctomycetota bacterium]
MKIYTRGGDKGETGLVGGRVSKADLRIEASGNLDEANSLLGLARSSLALPRHADLDEVLSEVQNHLFSCGSVLSRKEISEESELLIGPAEVEYQEAQIDRLSAELPELRRFILPGGVPAAATLQLCRAVVRRAERRIAAIEREDRAFQELQCYINRLSDLLFTLARVVNIREGAAEAQYERGAEVFTKGRKATP